MTATADGYPTEQCRTESCRAAIVWARTSAGRSMPVDAEPSADGNVRLFTSQGIVWARVVGAADVERMRRDPLAEPLRTSHFATCAAAGSWRKR